MSNRITLGCPLFDIALGGGIAYRYLTEIVGESGVGKTQICLQLALNVQIPSSVGGLSSSALYIQTDLPFPSRRLDQLQASFIQKYNGLIQHNTVDKIYVQKIESASDFLVELPRIQTLVAASTTQSMPIKLIVIDCVASFFRTYYENNPTDMRRRAEHMYEITDKLKEWARIFNLSVVLVNQIINFIPSHYGIGRWEGLTTSGRKVCPALRPTWNRCIGNRIFLARDIEDKRHVQPSLGIHFPMGRCEYIIVREGVFGVFS